MSGASDRPSEYELACMLMRAFPFRKARRQARLEGLSLAEYLKKAVETDIAVAKLSADKIGHEAGL